MSRQNRNSQILPSPNPLIPASFSLNGDWLFKDYMGKDWVWRNSVKPDTRDTRGWLSGRVPGSVQHDLWQNGAIPNPYFERNSLLIEWVPGRTWLYKRTFQVEEGYRGRRWQLRFEGVDYEVTFFLNGRLIGRHCSQFTPAVFEVSEQLRYGEENLIAVVLEAAPLEQPQVSYTSLVRTHKTRMNYWWDFCPRMIHLGIWDGVYLDVSGPVRIEDLYVRPQLNDAFDQAAVAISAELSATEFVTVEVETTIHYEGAVVARHRSRHALARGRTTVNLCLELAKPHLWWPNGEGEQALYGAEMRVFVVGLDPVGFGKPTGSGEGEESDGRVVTFGVRRVAFARNETSDGRARPYTLVVNGRPIYIKGWNWVPLDALYGVERPAKLERLLTLAKNAHVNLLRVWGGGLIEKEAFYHLCDRYGILVWQELIQSSSGIENRPSDSPEFVALMAEEAAGIIPRRRNHACLAIWCGGNELQEGEEKPLDDSHPVLAVLKAAVAEHDPGRHWLPSSPSGPLFSNSLENMAADPLGLHDVHGPWEYQGVSGQFELYNRGTSLLHSEFGVEGITNPAALDTTIAAEHQWPVSLDNPVWYHLGAWWLKERTLKAAWGDLPDVATTIRAAQFLQADGLRYAVEANRRRQYQNSGSLPWQLNESYPMAACTSAVDYYGRPKPAYYAVARAYAPLLLSARFETQCWEGRDVFTADIWLSNGHDTPIEEAMLTIRLVGASGRVYDEQRTAIAAATNRSTPLLTYEYPLSNVGEAVFFLDLQLDFLVDRSSPRRNRYLFTRSANLAPLLSQPATMLSLSPLGRDSQSDMFAIRNDGHHTAFFVQVEDARPVAAEGYLYLDDNYFCLFPNETHTLTATWDSVPTNQRQLQLQAWNALPLFIP